MHAPCLCIPPVVRLTVELGASRNDDWRQRYLDTRTYDKLWEESEDAEAGKAIGLMRLTQTE